MLKNQLIDFVCLQLTRTGSPLSRVNFLNAVFQHDTAVLLAFYDEVKNGDCARL